jgi:hypothetical protein
MRRLLACLGFGLVATTGACFFGGNDDDDRLPPPDVPECTQDGDCADLDDGDVCFAAPVCRERSCRRDFLQDAEGCQCQSPWDCRDLGMEELGCNVVMCAGLTHQCSEEIAPAGPAPEQDVGGCSELRCDGESRIGFETVDVDDIDDDGNPCTVDSCSEAGPLHEPFADGEPCADTSGLCYSGVCAILPGCQPANPEACGGEGPSEPANDTGTGASQYSEYAQVCGMLDEDDVDWFKLYLVDEDFEENIIGFDFHGSAPTLEVCAYVRCNNAGAPDGGYPDGGCDTKLDGPDGSLGCCWQGAPESLEPTWNLNCTGTEDDGGTLWFSVRAIGGDACDTYTLSAHY